MLQMLLCHIQSFFFLLWLLVAGESFTSVKVVDGVPSTVPMPKCQCLKVYLNSSLLSQDHELRRFFSKTNGFSFCDKTRKRNFFRWFFGKKFLHLRLENGLAFRRRIQKRIFDLLNIENQSDVCLSNSDWTVRNFHTIE